MAGKSTRVEETPVPPELTKGSSSNGGPTVVGPGAGGRRPGGSDLPARNQGLRPYHSVVVALRRRPTEAKNVERLIRRSGGREA